MISILICILMIGFNFLLYFIIGSLIVGRNRKEYSVTLSILAGFFLYYSLFTCVCVPIMYRWRPLSMLTRIWSIVIILLLMVSVILNRKVWIAKSSEVFESLKKNRWFFVGIALIVLVQTLIILYNYQFTLDAAYYVANVTTSIQTDSMNIYDPYTGDWQDHFEMRYFFATYPMNDSVMCQLFPIHPLMQTKIIMASVAVLLTNLLYYMIGKELFGDKKQPIFWMMVFAAIMNFNFITIYTSSNFLITRTYEGKSLLGNVVLPAILYLYIRLLREHKNRRDWLLLFLVCFGSTVLSSSSNMLVPAAVSLLFLPLALMKKDWKIIPRFFVCILPCLIMLVVYVAYVKGYFVFYTAPR